MDLQKTIQELLAEKAKLDRVIASLENLEIRRANQLCPSGKGGRGRKSMAPEERLEVSARMKRYWQSRRQLEKRD